MYLAIGRRVFETGKKYGMLLLDDAIMTLYNRGWISPEDRASLLCEASRQGHLPLACNIDLLGFDEFSPAQQDLLSALIENGTRVVRLAIATRQNKTVLWETKSQAKKELFFSWERCFFS